MILSVKLSPIVVFGDKYAGLFRQERINLAANIPPCRGKRHLNLTHLKGYGGQTVRIVDTKKPAETLAFSNVYLDDTAHP